MADIEVLKTVFFHFINDQVTSLKNWYNVLGLYT